MSPTFYAHLFHAEVFAQLFCTYSLHLYFLAKANGENAACKCLMNLTIGLSLKNDYINKVTIFLLTMSV